MMKKSCVLLLTFLFCFGYPGISTFSQVSRGVKKKRSLRNLKPFWKRNTIDFVGRGSVKTSLKYAHPGPELIEIDLCDFADGVDFVMAGWMKAAPPHQGLFTCGFSRYRIVNSCKGQTAAEATQIAHAKDENGKWR